MNIEEKINLRIADCCTSCQYYTYVLGNKCCKYVHDNYDEKTYIPYSTNICDNFKRVSYVVTPEMEEEMRKVYSKAIIDRGSHGYTYTDTQNKE